MIKLLLGTAIACLWVNNANAQNTVLYAGQLINVDNGNLERNRYIIIQDGKITSIGSKVIYDGLENAGDYTFIDLSDMTVLPGLSDSHVHLTSDANNHGYKGLAVSTPRAAIAGVVNARKTLMAGFTTVRNLGAPGFADIDLMNAIDAGVIAGPRMIPAGHSIGITGGHCDSNLLPYEYKKKSNGVANGPWEVRTKVRENNKYGAKVIKFCGTGGFCQREQKSGRNNLALRR